MITAESQTASAPVHPGGHQAGFEYVEDGDHVLHPVHRAYPDGSAGPHRIDGEPAPLPENWSAEVSFRLPAEDHGWTWGAPVEPIAGGFRPLSG